MLPRLSLLWSVVAFCFAAPVELDVRAGPSGQVISPAGGLVLSQLNNDILYFKYKPVTEATNPGYATQYVNLYIWNQDTDVTTPLAIGLTAQDMKGDSIRSGIIAANFSFAAGGFCGNRLQLVVREFQTGALAPTYGFQAAAPYFRIKDCFSVQTDYTNPDYGTWYEPDEGATLGAHRDSAAIHYQPNQFESVVPYRMDIDVQPASVSMDDASSWKPVIHYAWPHFYQDYGAPTLYFSAMHWGILGPARLRITTWDDYSFPEMEWSKGVTYREVNIVDTY